MYHVSALVCLKEKFVPCDYMPKQPSLNTEMRAILIDWLVEVQVRSGVNLPFILQSLLYSKTKFVSVECENTTVCFCGSTGEL